MKRAAGRIAKAGWIIFGLAGLLNAGGLRASACALQGETDVSPEATPQIQQVKPNQAAAGEEVTVTIEGRNFSRGAYVSFTNPAVHVVSTRRVSATQLEAQLAISRKAQAGTVSLFVSNPASSVAEAPFTIAGGAAPPAVPPAPPAPATPTAEIQPSGLATPEVSAVDPPRATPGSQVSVKITGKNFAKTARVSFSNPGIRVLETNATTSTELMTRIQIASDAPAGTSSLFVVNPDDREAEVPFEVAGGAPAALAKTTTAAETTGAAAQRFEVYNLGEGMNILQSLNKPKGALMVAAGKLRYEEGGREMFSAGPGDLKEIEVTSVAGFSTGTFHVTLSSGKTFNFAPASLRPADSQAIVDSLHRALK
jgi:hypothetical protein